MIDTQSNIGGFGGNPIPIPVVNTNIYNADGTLTANRVVTGGGFTLTFDAKTTVKAYSNLSTDTAFNVRNFSDSGDLVQIKGNGDAFFNAPNGVEMTYMRANTWNTRNDALALMTYDQESLGELYTHRRTTFGREMEIRLQTATTANFKVKNFDNTKTIFNITELGSVKTVSPSASILDTAFAVRNNTDTNNHFQVLGNGSVYSTGKNYSVDDTVYGYNAGSNMGAGAYFNTFFGSNAGLNVAGAGCVAVGRSAMVGNSTFSVAIGSQAMGAGSNYSVAIGSNAMFNSTGEYNVVMGQNVGYELTTGSQNTFIGTQSGRAITTGSFNIHVGSGVSGALGVTTGSKNTIISAKTTGLPSAMTGSTIIGYGASATGNNQFSVGSVAENAGTVTAEVNASANVWNVIINGVARKILLA